MGVFDRWRAREAASHGIELDEAMRLLAAGAVLVDVRGPRSYRRAHIPGSRSVTPGQLRPDPAAAIWGGDPLADRKAGVILVCDAGLVSAGLVPQLRAAGLEAYWLIGGVLGWSQAGQPLVPGPPR